MASEFTPKKGLKLPDQTASRALTTDANSKVTSSSVTSTELGYVSGVTSAIQTQLNTGSTNLTNHLNDTTDAHAASAIGNTPSGNLAATDVQAALNELQSDVDTRATSTALTNHLNDTTDAHAASAIGNTPSGNLAATDVQAALNELQSDVDGRTSKATLTAKGSIYAATGASTPAELAVGATNGHTLQVDSSTATGLKWAAPAAVAIGDTITSATAGSILFGGTAGVLAQDNTNLFWDDTNNRLYLGYNAGRAIFNNSTDTAPLQVEGTTTNTSSATFVQNSNDALGPAIYLGKTRGTTTGSVTAVTTAGDDVGRVSFQGSDGTQFVEAAAVLGEIDGTPGANDMPGRLAFYTTADGAASGTERMRIDSSGNMGIGVTSPGARLDIAQTSTFSILAGADSAGGGARTNATQKLYREGVPHYTNSEEPVMFAQVDATSTTNDIYIGGGSSATNAATSINLYTAANNTTTTGSNRMSIDSSGNVGINVTPTSKLHVKGIFTVEHDGTNQAQIKFKDETTNIRTTIGTELGTDTDAFYIHCPSDSIYLNTAASTPDTSTGLMVASTGKVAIGHNSPAQHLHVKTSGSTIRTEDTATSGNYIDVSSNTDAHWLWGVGTGASLKIGVNNSERARIDTNGTFMVGTTTPFSANTKLMAYGSAGAQRIFSAENAHNTSGDELVRLLLGTNCNNTSSYHFICTTGGTDRLYIYGNGNVVNTGNSYGLLSDVKLKENIVDATPKLDKLMDVRIVNYNLKSDPGVKHLGVIAQELEQVFPGLIDEHPDKDAEGNPTGTSTKSVKMSIFTPILVKALQELNTKFDALKTEFDAYKEAHP